MPNLYESTHTETMDLFVHYMDNDGIWSCPKIYSKREDSEEASLEILFINDNYIHYKGGLYTYLFDSTHIITGMKLANYTDSNGKIWTRPYDMFFGTVDINGQEVPRFVIVKQEEENTL